ncbi:MAG: phosphoribosylglycinamide synthetase C domain-containing protein, partial [Oscillospiraceae bacterium]
KEVEEECFKNVFNPTIKAMSDMGCPFKGVLYFGLMKTSEGIKVIEYNCRLGDPETQVCFPLLESDLIDIMNACIDGNLKDVEVKNSNKAAACVIAASGGYPQKYSKGLEISGLKEAESLENVNIFHAGTKLIDGKFYTDGGRVLGVGAVGETLEAALKRAYEAVSKISFDDMFYRKDIGAKAINTLKEEK